MKKAIQALENIQETMATRRKQLESGKVRLVRVSPKPPIKQKDKVQERREQISK